MALYVETVNRKILVSIFAVLISDFISAFGKEESIVRVKADYCVSLNVLDSQAEVLISELDDSSYAHGFIIDKSSPVSIVYKNRKGDEIVTLRFLFGEYGNILSH